VPRVFDRRGRVELIGEAATALLAGRTESGLFVGGALLAWLENGGDLERDFLQVVKPKSHATPSAIWRQSQAHNYERQDTEAGDTLAPSLSKSRTK
jgi:hypothetical protein